MKITLRRVTGPVVLPTGESPTFGRIELKLSGWDRELGQLVLPGPVSGNIDGGLVDLDIWAADQGEHDLTYTGAVIWYDQSAGMAVRHSLPITIAVPAGAGDLVFADLVVSGAPESTQADALAQAQAYASLAQTAAARAVTVVTAYTETAVDAAQAAADAVAQVPKSTFDATRAPLPSDDTSQGYAVGSRWLWQGREWVAASVGAGVAVWEEQGAADFPVPTSTVKRPVVQRLRDSVSALDLMSTGGLDEAVRNREATSADAAEIFDAVQETMQDCAAKRRRIVIPSGRYYLDSRLSVSGPLTIAGDGMGMTVLEWIGSAASRGLHVVAGAATIPTEISGLTLLTAAIGAGTALEVDYSGNISSVNSLIMPRTATRLRLANVQMKGVGTTTGWLHHLDAVSVVGAAIAGCSVEGIEDTTTRTSLSAYRFRGEGIPVELVLKDSWAYFVQDAVKAERSEGLFVDSCNFVAVDRGVYFTSSDNRPQCHVTNNHINSYDRGIILDNCREANISGNLIYSRQDGVPPGTVGVDITASSHDNLMKNNIFRRCGVRDGGTRSVVEGNIFQLSPVAIDVLATSLNSIERTNEFVDVVTGVVSASTSFTRASIIRGWVGNTADLAGSNPGVCYATLGSTVSGVPTGEAGIGSFVITTVYNADAAYQEFFGISTSARYFRAKKIGTWSGWQRMVMLPAGGPQDITNTVHPEGAVSAPEGSTYRRTGSAIGPRFFVKDSGGTGNTGWVAAT